MQRHSVHQRNLHFTPLLTQDTLDGMPLRLKLTIAISVLFHAALIVGLANLSTWRLKEVKDLSSVGGVVWINLNPGGQGSGGPGGMGAPAETRIQEILQGAYQNAIEESEQARAKEKSPVAVKRTPPVKEKSPPPEAEKKSTEPPPQFAIKGPGAGDDQGSQSGTGQGEGEGKGAGKGPGVGGGEGQGGLGPPGTGGGGTGGEGSRVLAMIRNKILKAKRYPRQARNEGIEGICGLSFQINPDGSLAALNLTQSCGHNLLDEEAVATVRRAAPFPYYAGPIRFKLKFSLKDCCESGWYFTTAAFMPPLRGWNFFFACLDLGLTPQATLCRGSAPDC